MLKTIKLLLKLRLFGLKAKLIEDYQEIADDEFCVVSEYFTDYAGE